MPRRWFVLLMIAVFVGLWTPPQSTTAQTDCPEGGCKVFLPAVFVPEYIRVVGWDEVPERYCNSITIEIRLENVGQELVTGFRLTGLITISESSTIPVDQTLTNQTIYPGGIASVYVGLPDCQHPSDASFQVSAVGVVHKHFVPLKIVSKSTAGPTKCVTYGTYTYQISGEVQNDTNVTVSNIAVVIEGEQRADAAATMRTLAQGQRTTYQGTFDRPYYYDGDCVPSPQSVVVKAWGEIVP